MRKRRADGLPARDSTASGRSAVPRISTCDMSIILDCVLIASLLTYFYLLFLRGDPCPAVDHNKGVRQL